MRLDILTLFPEMFSAIQSSIIKRAIDKKLIEVNVYNIRDFSTDVHLKCDDTPYGGGAGMVMTPQPIYDAVKFLKKNDSKVIYLSPRGKTLVQKQVVELSKQTHIILICGHYEGIDERVLELCDAEEISIGDYILTGGELPAMVLIDAVSRYVDGVISNQSLEEESFSNGLLEYPQYTRPQNFMGKEVPEVLLSGNHKEIELWRKEKSTEITKKNRPDLLGGAK